MKNAHSYNDSRINSLYAISLLKSLQEDTTIGEQEYKALEYSPFIETTVTDADMLKLHIDIALATGNEEEFMKLTNQL